MIALAFTDLHADLRCFKKIKAKIKKHNPDVLLFLGDLAYFDQNVKLALEKINSLQKPILLIPGNSPHESAHTVGKECRKFKNITFAHKSIIDIGDGYSVIGHGGGGFYHGNSKDKDFETFINKNKSKIKYISDTEPEPNL